MMWLSDEVKVQRVEGIYKAEVRPGSKHWTVLRMSLVPAGLDRVGCNDSSAGVSLLMGMVLAGHRPNCIIPSPS